MDRIRSDIFEKFEVRKSYKQKTAFIQWVKELCEEQGVACRVEEGGIFRSRNIILGDAENAEVLFTAHYDTCARMPFPNLIFPKNFLLTFLLQFLFIVPFFEVIVAAAVGALLLVDSFLLYIAVLYAGLFGFLWLLMAGPANPHTANDNTSGTVAVLRIMAQLKEGKAAAVLFDHEELGLVGSSLFYKKYKAACREKLVLNLDCVSDGGHLLFVAKKKAVNDARFAAFRARVEETAAAHGKNTVFYTDRQAMYPSDQAHFPLGVGVAACNKKKFFGLYLGRIHTARDTVFDEENLAALEEAAVRFVQEDLQ